MTYYSVLAVTPTTDQWVADYVEAANKLIKKHGGKFLARTTSHETLEGEGQEAALRVMIEWPSKDAATAFVNDPDYVPHLKARLDGSESHHFLIEGKDELAG